MFWTESLIRQLLPGGLKRMLPTLLKLLLVLDGVINGTSSSTTNCETFVQYFGALGRSVHIHLANTSDKDLIIEVHYKGYEVFGYKNNAPRYNKTLVNHFKFLGNGTLRLENLTESLSGKYSIAKFNSDGKNEATRCINLTIQVPVSPPGLSQLCLPHGEIRVSCSSRGDYPEYSWALGGRPLDGGVAFLSNETQTVILRRNISGSITCTVSNRASREHTTQELLTCPGLGAPVNCTMGNGNETQVQLNASLDASSLLNNTKIFFWVGEAQWVSAICKSYPHTPNETCSSSQQPAWPTRPDSIIVPAALGTCLILLALLLGTCCLYKKKQKQPKTNQRMNGYTSDDPQELVYCQVQVGQKKERSKKQQQEPQVVYGEVKVSDNSKAVRHMARREEDTVYSGIRS